MRSFLLLIITAFTLSSCASKKAEPVVELTLPATKPIRGVWINADSSKGLDAAELVAVGKQISDAGFNTLFIPLKTDDGELVSPDGLYRHPSLKRIGVYPLYWGRSSEAENFYLGTESDQATGVIDFFQRIHDPLSNETQQLERQRLAQLDGYSMDGYILSHYDWPHPRFAVTPESLQQINASKSDVIRFDSLANRYVYGSRFADWQKSVKDRLALQNQELLNRDEVVQWSGVILPRPETQPSEPGATPALTLDFSQEDSAITVFQLTVPFVSRVEAQAAGYSQDASLQAMMESLPEVSGDRVVMISAMAFAGDDLMLVQEEKERMKNALQLAERSGFGTLVLDWDILTSMQPDFKFPTN